VLNNHICTFTKESIFYTYKSNLKKKCMITKLTLTIEKSVIEKAKKYAKEQQREVELTPIVKSLRGSFKAPDDFDYEKELSKALSSKYLKS